MRKKKKKKKDTSLQTIITVIFIDEITFPIPIHYNKTSEETI